MQGKVPFASVSFMSPGERRWLPGHSCNPLPLAWGFPGGAREMNDSRSRQGGKGAWRPTLPSIHHPTVRGTSKEAWPDQHGTPTAPSRPPARPHISVPKPLLLMPNEEGKHGLGNYDAESDDPGRALDDVSAAALRGRGCLVVSRDFPLAPSGKPGMDACCE